MEIATDTFIRVTGINHHHIGVLLNELAHDGIGRKTLSATTWAQAEEVRVIGEFLFSFLSREVYSDRYALPVGIVYLQRCHLVMLHAFLIEEAQG